MPIQLGPILGFRGSNATHWNVSILVVTNDAADPAVTVAPGSVAAPVTLKTLGIQRALRFDVAVPLTNREQRVKYTVAGDNFDFYVPPGGLPTRMAYGSCNGLSSAKLASAFASEAEKNERWQHILARHTAKDTLSKNKRGSAWEGQPFHLLLLGGDQIYGDGIFEMEGPIHDWQGEWWQFWKGDKTKVPFSAAMKAQAAEFYFNRTYVKFWSATSVAAVLARVPSLMMWDDHDVFDGWGSHPAELQGSPVFQGLFKAARESFEVFQLQTTPGTAAPGKIAGTSGFSFAHRFGKLAILAPDMRSERTMFQVLSDKSWEAIRRWLDETAKLPEAERPQHLLFMSSIPLIYVSLDAAEQMLATIPGQQELEDDLRDHWCSRLHQGEQKRLVRWLLDFAKKADCRVTILSGDVHVAAFGRVTSKVPEHVDGGYAASMNQLISTALVHPPPSMAQAFFIDQLVSGEPPALEPGIVAEMLKIPGTGSRLRAKRNWLSLSLSGDEHPELWANWWFEGEDNSPATHVIHQACKEDV